MRQIGSVLGLLVVLWTVPAGADEIRVKLGVLNDRSSLFADITGEGSVLATQMAVEDFRKTDQRVAAEIIFADHQNKPDLGIAIGRRWFDQDGVDAIVDVPGSAIAFGLAPVAIEKRRILLTSGSGAAQLSGTSCTANTVQWAYDTWSQANVVGRAVVEAGGTSWFMITDDYAFGHALELDLSNAVKASGGTVMGAVRVPLGSMDFSSALLQAQASGAKVIGLALAGADLINAVKQAHEFGIAIDGRIIATPVMFITDVKSLGLDTAQGLLLATPFYWDRDDATRDFSRRFAQRLGGKPPTFIQAANYSVTLHYLKAVAAVGTKDADKVMAKMHEMPTDDVVFGPGTLAANNRHVHKLYLYRVKAPGQSKSPWDLYELVATVPGEHSVRPLSETGCPLVTSR